MHHRTAVFLVAGAALAAVLPAAPPTAIADTAAWAVKVARATVLVEACSGNETRTGSGFFLDRPGLVATALHTVVGARSIRVAIPGRYAASAARLRAASSTWDLAILEAAWPDAVPYPGLALDAAQALPTGAEVAVTGFGLLDGDPSRTALTIRGIVSGAIEHRGGVSYVLDLQARQGLSGSPVYRTDTGAVVGLLTRVHAPAQGWGPGGAAPAAAIAELLSGLDAPRDPEPPRAAHP